MLKTQTNPSGVETIENVSHPFVRRPDAGLSTVFPGWGPRI